jgi:hypothetical protein
MAKILVGRKPARVRETDCRDSSHHYQQLIRQTRRLKPIRTAMVHPVDASSLLGAIEAAKANLIVPVLVGPEARIRAAAHQTSIDLSPYELLPAEHSHAAAALAVGLARDHKVDALMKGSLHTDEFMSAVVGEEKLRTARRMSHVFIIDAPRYPKPLFVTDAALNIYPTLEEKAVIVQNAICLAHILGWNVQRSRSYRQSRQCRRRSNPPWTQRSCARWRTEGRSRVAYSTVRWPLTMRSPRKPQTPRISFLPLPAERTSSSSPISIPAICWRSSSNTWQVPR